MRRILIPALALLLALGLAACGDAPATPGDAGPSGATGTAGDAGTTDGATDGKPAVGDAEKPAANEEAAHDKGEADPDAPCLCVMGLAGDPIWCKQCKKGYVDSKEVCCPGCVKKAQKKLAAEKAAAEKTGTQE